MFGFDSSELAVVVILALIFIGPKDLPKVMRTIGYWVGRVRGMARHFTAGIETMVREAELEEMERRWREENERIMSIHPPGAHYPEPGKDGDLPQGAQEAPAPAGEPNSAVSRELSLLDDLAEPGLPFDERQKEEQLPIEKRPLP